MAITILEGSTFCICDDRGDIDGETQGLFADDTRFLSLLRLTVNGAKPLLLSYGKVEYFSAAFYLRNPLAGGLPPDSISITRHRFVGEGMQDRVVVQNQSMEPLACELALEFGADFADILSVKEHDFALGDPTRAKPLPSAVEGRYEEEHNQFVLEEPDGAGSARVQVILSGRGRIEGPRVVYPLELEPRQSWELRLDMLASIDGDSIAPRAAERRFGEEMTRVRESLAAWQLRVPQVRADWDQLGRAFFQSVSDLASLRMRRGDRAGRLPAAGMPWFMTVFGRDTIITCLQTLLFGPELARTALEVLAELQARDDNPDVDAEPGKIVHELRTGKAAQHWFRTYYGTVDATPLYLVLLSEVWRWTDDSLLVRELKEPALKALAWIDEYGDRDGDGFVEYERRTPRGLAQLGHQRVVVRPAPDLGEQHEVEGRRIDGAVVALEPVLGRLAVADLVDDLSRLRVDGRVVLVGLQLGERLERAPRELGPEEERLQAGNDRVPAEDGHEPGHACGEEAPAPRARADAQRREVRDGLPEGVPKPVPRRVELGNAQTPGRERVADPVPLVAEAPLDELGHLDLSVEGHHEVEACLPALARRKLDPVANGRAVRLSLGREDDLRAGYVTVGGVLEEELAVGAVVAPLDELRQRVGAHRVSEREVVLLDREDVGKVAAELELQLEGRRRERLVLDREVVLHSHADEPVARDRELILLEPARERVPHVEGGGEVLDLVRREQERALAVDPKPHAGEEARVLGEEAGGRPVDVADLVADAERGAFEDGERHGYSSRWIRTALDCASALITISSMLTRLGRVTAKRTHSAMSSAASGSTPS